MKTKEWFTSDSMLSLVVGIVIVALGFTIGLAQNYISITGILFALALVVIDVILLLLFLRISRINELNRISQNCRIISESKALRGITIRLDGLITVSELKVIESSATQEVWVMCPSLLLDRGHLGAVIIANMERGVKYRYILPDTKQVKARYQQLINDWKRHAIDVEHQVEVIFIKHSEIFTDVGIYDPITENAKAVIWTPPIPEFEKYGEKYQKGFLIDDPEPIDYLVSFFQGLWEERDEKEVTRLS